MQTHLDNECLGIPNNAKSKQNVNSQGFNSTAQNITPNINPNTTSPNAPTNRPVKRTKKTKTSDIRNFVDHIGEGEQEDLEFQLALVLFSAGVSFAFVDNSHVIQF